MEFGIFIVDAFSYTEPFSMYLHDSETEKEKSNAVARCTDPLWNICSVVYRGDISCQDTEDAQQEYWFAT